MLQELTSCDRVMGPTKSRWTQKEDDMLLDLVKQNGPRNWHIIARSIPGRTGKQCRERWLCRLSPDQRHDEWTQIEDEILIKLQSEKGNKWSLFRDALPGRSATAIKNRWTSLKRRGKGQTNPEMTNDLLKLRTYS